MINFRVTVTSERKYFKSLLKRVSRKTYSTKFYVRNNMENKSKYNVNV